MFTEVKVVVYVSEEGLLNKSQSLFSSAFVNATNSISFCSNLNFDSVESPRTDSESAGRNHCGVFVKADIL